MAAMRLWRFGRGIVRVSAVGWRRGVVWKRVCCDVVVPEHRRHDVHCGQGRATVVRLIPEAIKMEPRKLEFVHKLTLGKKSEAKTILMCMSSLPAYS